MHRTELFWISKTRARQGSQVPPGLVRQLGRGNSEKQGSEDPWAEMPGVDCPVPVANPRISRRLASPCLQLFSRYPYRTVPHRNAPCVILPTQLHLSLSDFASELPFLPHLLRLSVAYLPRSEKPMPKTLTASFVLVSRSRVPALRRRLPVARSLAP